MAEMARARRFRPGLIDLYLLRGAAGPFLLLLLAVGAAMMLERTLRLVHELAAAGADIGYLLPLLVRLAPYYLDLAIPASFMVALVLLVARLDERLELEAMLASGLPLARIAAPLVALGVLVGLGGLVAGGWLEPLGRHEFRLMRMEALNAGRLGRLEPRALYHPAESLAVTFDRRGPGGSVAGLFVWQRLDSGEELILTGGSGRIGFTDEGRGFGIDLRDGRYVAEREGGPQTLRFDVLSMREPLSLDERWARGADQKELTLSELASEMRSGTRGIPQRRLEAEFYARLGRAAVVPLIPLLVLPLAFATKKGRRTLGIVLCGTALAAVHHGMSFAKNVALSGAVEPATAIVGATGMAAALALAVFVTGRHLPSHSPIQAALQPLGRVALRLAPRAKALPSLRGRTVATYLAFQIGKWTLIALAAAVALLQMVDLLERGEAFVARGMGPSEVARYALLRLPPMVQQAIPIAALAGAMAAFAGLGRSHELTAVRAAGISQWRLLAIALPVPLALGLASLMVAELAVPASQLRFASWWSATAPPGDAAAPSGRWFRIGDEIVRAGAASADGAALRDVSIFRRDGEGRLEERVAAASAVAGAAGWTLRGVRLDRFAEGRVERSGRAELRWPAPLDPEDVAAMFAANPWLTASAARRALSEAAPVSRSESLFETRVHRSAAEPLAPLVMLMLALPLAFVSPRTGRAWPATLYAAAGGLLYLVADGVLTVAAQVGYLPAAVGAWAAPAVAALGAITVLLYSER